MLLWFMCTTTMTFIIAFLHRFLPEYYVDLYGAVNPGNMLFLPIALLLSIITLGITSLRRYELVVITLLFFNWMGAFDTYDFWNFVSSVALSMLVFLTFLRVIHILLGKMLPVACPRCGSVIKREYRESCRKGIPVSRKTLEENFICTSCGNIGGVMMEVQV